METYNQLKKRHEKELNDLPVFWAFGNEQFEKGMQKFGLKPTETNKIVRIGMGGFAKKTDLQIVKDMFARHPEEMKAAIENDKTGESFIVDMFDYELSNHEYIVTYNPIDAVESLGFTMEEVEKSPILLKGLKLAQKNQIERFEKNM